MDFLTHRGITANLVNALLVVTGGAATTVATTGIVTPVLDGKFDSTLATGAGQATPTTDATTAAAFPVLVGGNSVANTPGQGAVVVWGVIAGVLKASQGPIEKLDMLGSFINAPQFPSLPSTMIPFAYQVLKAGATAGLTIQFGTSNWNATGFTNTIVNIFQIPSRPQVS